MDGTPFGRYRLVELLGRGGMGEVWRAYDPDMNRVVALKVLRQSSPGDQVSQERFRREARAAAGLDEPHVVPIYEFGEIEGRLYVTMRLIRGHDLQELLQGGPLDPFRAVNIIEQIASALHAAHQIGLVHRDVKPSNILVAEDDFAYLIDFGIARAAGETGLTSTGATIGTGAYMSPERLNTGHADARADIYALACVLHEALTGQRPFPGNSLEQQIVGHLTTPPPRPSTLRPGVPEPLDAVVATGMAKDLEQRYPTTKDLAQAARAALTTPIRQPGSPGPPSTRVSAAPAPTGVVTFLSTDVEGSTRRWAADAEGMRVMLAAHDELLRRAIEAYGGWLFKHSGDGVWAAFAAPRSAVDAAVAAQRALELPVRMGIATGEAELRDGEYFGAVLDRAAGVMAAGHGGQILLADSTAGLLSGIDLLYLGPRRLRDLPTTVGLFQVRASGLQTEFPALRALDVPPGNLRPQTTSLVGRQSEVAEVQAVLRSHRLVTLTGVGGVGKTRLALEVAARLADEFPDGVWFFELAAVADPAAVPAAVAAVLGITQQPGRSMTASVSAALEGRVRLLVFDNCEHVRDAAADLIEAILAHSASVKVLATSREGLGVGDEQLWQVPSLDVGAGVDSAAVKLFVERARSVASRFSVATPDEAAAVVEICRRLEGIPLAIELAASRMGSMTASEVCDRLDQRFRLLVGSRRGPGRHQTLRHAVAWSYEHLDDPEKALLDRCSVFAGGFDLDSACAVGGPDESDDYAVLDRLDVLVRKSLLVADRSSGRTRFSMLETIRQFAAEQLAAGGAATEVRTAHARYFAARETDVLARWDSARQWDAYAWLSVELANLRAAFRWAADRGDLDVAAAIATYAAFLGIWVDSYEPMAWAEELIEAARAVDHPRLAFLYVMASGCWMPGRIEQAVRYSDAAQRVIASGRYEVPFGFEGVLGAAYVAIGQPERWVKWCRAQLARGRDTHTFTRAALVVALAFAGCGEEARAAANGLIDAAEATHNPWALSFALYAHGYAFRAADPAGALEALRRGLVIAQDSGNRFTESFLAGTVSRLEAEHGDPQAALDYVTLAIRNFHDAGNTTTIRNPLAVLAALFDRLGRYEPAATTAGFAVNPFVSAAVPEINTAIAHLREVLGDPAYESLARAGEKMTTAAMATYAYHQIDQARAELNAVSE